jgi:hypothetical protein
MIKPEWGETMKRKDIAEKTVGLRGRFWPQGMPLWHRDVFWVGFVLLLAVAIAIWACVPKLQRWEILATMVAACWGVVYFLRQQHLEETRFFRELFLEFNHRYDSQNNKLLGHINGDRSKALTPDQRQDFVDYFNLCAEEWLFYKAGYIYRPVWEAWRKGMRQFGRDHRVAALWREESQTESYYGFEFPVEMLLQTQGKALVGEAVVTPDA